MPRPFHVPQAIFVLALTLGAACAPAAPSPTVAPPKPAPTAAPAKPAEAPKPTAAPAKPTEAPAARPTETPAAKPVAKPAEQPAARPAFDEQAVADFYRGKTVRIIVGFSAGGGFDTYARLIARHLGQHVPGNPTVIVENQEGAGSLRAANTVYASGARDGTVLTHFIGTLVLKKFIVEDPAVEFDPLQYTWLGVPVPDTPACAVRKESGFTSLAQARDKELILGTEAPGSTTEDIPSVLKQVLGLNIKKVSGYGGTSRIRLAADQGEIHGGCWGWQSVKVTWKEALEKKAAIVLAQGGATPHPDLKDVPLISSLARTDQERRLVQAGITAPGQITRTFALPPGVPSERVQAMRQAFMATLKDPDFLAEAQKADLEIDPVTPEQVVDTIRQLQALPPELKARLKSALLGQ